MLVVGLAHGCSFAWHDVHVHTPPTSKADCPGRVSPVLDTVGAGAFAALAGYAAIHRDDADSAAEIFIVPFALAALAYGASAAYGFTVPGRCERGFAE